MFTIVTPKVLAANKGLVDFLIISVANAIFKVGEG